MGFESITTVVGLYVALLFLFLLGLLQRAAEELINGLEEYIVESFVRLLHTYIHAYMHAYTPYSSTSVHHAVPLQNHYMLMAWFDFNHVCLVCIFQT